MSDISAPLPTAAQAPKIGFVSLGCPKNLTDSELILTQLSAEGYQTSKTFQGADLVIVNTCGFIDDAVRESLDTIGEALAENGRVIVTGCLGAKAGKDGSGTLIQDVHPSVLAVTGPHAAQEVMDAVHRTLPKPHDPFLDLVPGAIGEAGIKLTPRHYAYMKISEGCNHRCTFCIIPSMRGDLVSRPIGDVLKEARALFEGGVKELLVVSQDTSAYGVDVKYRTGFWDGKPVRTRLLELVQALGELAKPYGAWVRLHYVYPYPSVDEIVPLMSAGLVLPYLDVPLQHSHPDVLRRMKRPASGERNLERIQRWREQCPELVVRSTFIAGFPGETEEEFQHLLDFVREAQIDRAGCFCLQRRARRRGQQPARHVADRAARGAPRALHGGGRGGLHRAPRAARGLDHAGAGGQGGEPGQEGRPGPQLCRCAGDRRRGAPAAGREGQQDLQERRLRARAHRGHARA